MSNLVPEQQRGFALDIVRKLREKGFEAYWAGGCVRDQLMRRAPKDYDVATNATPEQIRELFGRRRTLLVGAAFGTAAVVGPKTAGTVEITTFRRDAEYSDGRHPDRVTYSSAREDAARRDFTINGLFYDPVEQQVIDYVGGQKDLAEGIVRAIGRPQERFAEDKLRMVRAVRFAATFGFALEAETLAAIREMAGEVTVVSPERIAMEMRRILVEPGRADAVRLLVATDLAAAILPEIVAHDRPHRQQLAEALSILERLREPGFPLATAALLHTFVDAAGAAAICQRWRLSNKETERIVWLVQHRTALCGAESMRFSALQPLLVAQGIEDLLTLHELADQRGRKEVAYCRTLLAKPREQLDPPPLLSGDDLKAHGVVPGPVFRELLDRVRQAQLDAEIQTSDEALALIDRLLTHKSNQTY